MTQPISVHAHQHTQEPVSASQSDYLDNLATIQSTAPSDEALSRADRLLSRTPYASVALAALAAALQETDPDAAQLVLNAAELMAEHEAATI